MASVINTNTASLVAQRNLSSSQTNLTTSVQRLSSGLRINSAKDDAAGLGISQKLQNQIGTINQAVKNANDATSMVQTAEGAMSEVSTMLQRMKELSTQGANDSLSTTQKGYLASEMTALRDEIDKVAVRTTFNGKTLVNGSQASSVTQTGTLANGIGIASKGSVSNLVVASTATAATYTISFVKSDGADVIAGAATKIRMSNGTVSQDLSLGAITDGSSNSYNFSSFGISFDVNSNATLTNTLLSTAYASAANPSGGLSGATVVLAASGTGPTFQVGAGSTGTDDLTLSFGSMAMTATGSAGGGSIDATMSAVATALATFSATTTTANAETLSTAIGTAIDFVATKRAAMGAYANRIDHNVANLQAQSENLTASKSRITDTDYAAETAMLSRNQVMQQAATAMLSQANQMPNAVLSLLK